MRQLTDRKTGNGSPNEEHRVIHSTALQGRTDNEHNDGEVHRPLTTQTVTNRTIAQRAEPSGCQVISIRHQTFQT